MEPHQFGQIFCTRDRASEAYFRFFLLSTTERRPTADRVDSFSVRAIAHVRHLSLFFIYRRASAHSMCKIFLFACSRPSIGATISLAFRDPM